MSKVIRPTKGLVFINDNGIIKQFPLPATRGLLNNPKVQYFIQQNLLEVVEEYPQTKVKSKERSKRSSKQSKKGQ